MGGKANVSTFEKKYGGDTNSRKDILEHLNSQNNKATLFQGGIVHIVRSKWSEMSEIDHKNASLGLRPFFLNFWRLLHNSWFFL